MKRLEYLEQLKSLEIRKNDITDLINFIDTQYGRVILSAELRSDTSAPSIKSENFEVDKLSFRNYLIHESEKIEEKIVGIIGKL